MSNRWVAGIVTLVCTLLSSTPLRAQITVDGSLGPPQMLTGPYFKIGADLGQIRGRNLFHSFGQFNLRTFLDDNRQVTETATFTGPGSIANILSRVTGGSPSSINGLLRSAIPGANFFLLNPSGVIFGPNASLDVSGSFHVSTADFIRLADGGVFHASLGRQSVLTVAEPAAFGFLTPNPAAITVQGSNLAVPEGQTLSLIGGDVSIIGGAPSAPSGLTAPSGRIAIMSAGSPGIGSPGEIGFTPSTQASTLDPGGFQKLGRVDLSEAAVLDTSGTSGGGTIVIRGGRLVATGGSTAVGINASNVNGPTLGIDARLTEELLLDGSLFQTASLGRGRGGDIALNANALTVRNGARVESFSFRDGPGGNVTLEAPALTIDGAAVQALATRAGPGGGVVIKAGTLTLTGGAFVRARTGAAGASGSVTVTATDAISISGPSSGAFQGVFLTNSDGSGAAGTITLAAPTVTIDHGAVGSFATAAGAAGDVVMSAAQLVISNGAFVTSNASGSGRGGDVSLTASQSLSITGGPTSVTTVSTSSAGTGDPGRVLISTPKLVVDGGNVALFRELPGPSGEIIINVGTLAVTNGGAISGGTLSAGAGGNVIVAANESVLLAGKNSEGNASRIDSLTGGSGDAGRVQISTPRLTVDAGFITADTHGGGRGGDVVLNVGQLILTNEADVGSSATSLSGVPGFNLPAVTGPAGTVTINASESVVLAGRDTFITVLTNNTAPGGRISISTPSFTASDGSAVTAATAGAGRAGDVVVDVGSLTLTGGSIIDSTTLAAGVGGTVMVTARDVLLTGRDPLSGRSSRLSTNAQGTGRGGDVILRASNILLTDGGQLTARSTDVADAGSITIEAGRSFRSFNSSVTTTATQGEGGNVLLTAGRLVHLVGSEITTSVQSGVGGGGNITIDPPIVILDHSRIQANAFGGPGGNVRIVADVFLKTDSVLSASSALGVSGVIDVQAPITDVSGTLARLPEAIFQAAALLRAACQVRLAEGRTSSFVLAGRGGLAVEPGGLLGSPLLDEPLGASPAASPLSFSPVSFSPACR